MILDLEDSASDVFSEDNTSVLKKQAQEGLHEILPQLTQKQLSRTFVESIHWVQNIALET